MKRKRCVTSVCFYTEKQVRLLSKMQKLWEQHVMWTRLFIISAAAGLGDLDATTQRLLRNPMDFARELQPLYGAKIAGEFQNLLTAHLTIAAQLVNAAKSGHRDEIIYQEERWYANAREIAAFLGCINPYWSEERWNQLLADHLLMTEQEAVKRLTRQYSEDAKLYDRIEDEALEMADYMAEGIINQFRIR